MGYTEWISLTGDSIIRAAHSAILYNNKIYILGGYSNFPSFNYKSDVRIYNIDTDSWSAGTSNSEALAEHSAILYNDNMYVFGGVVNGSGLPSSMRGNILKYTISEDSWSTYDSTGADRRIHDSIIYNNKMYVIGGTTSPSGNTYNPIAVNIFDFSSSLWTTGTSYTPDNAQTHQRIALYRGRIYYPEQITVGGSNNDYTRLIEYDIVSASWSQKATFQQGTDGGLLRTAMCSSGAGNIFLFGGQGSEGLGGTGILHVYNIINNTWATSATDQTETSNHRLLFNSGILYWFAGVDNTTYLSNLHATSGNTLPSITITSTERSQEA